MRTTVEERLARVVRKAIQLNASMKPLGEAMKESGEGLDAYRTALARYTTLLELAQHLGKQLADQYGGRPPWRERKILDGLKKQDALNVERLKLVMRLETVIAKRRAA